MTDWAGSVRPVTADEFGEFLLAAELPFAADVRDSDIEQGRQRLELDRTLAAFDGGRIVATTAIHSFDVSVPGGSTPMAGVTAVGVLPTHRRRGLLTALMRRQLDDLHTGGEAVACLWSSEAPIYGRFGYGMAAFGSELTIEPAHGSFRRPAAPTRVGFVTLDEALKRFPAIYERARTERPGMPARTPQWWQLWLGYDPEHRREGRTARFLAMIGDRGYVVYRAKEGWKDWLPDNRVEIEELMADDLDAEMALWRYCLDMDLVTRVKASERPVDDVLPYVLRDPRRLRTLTHDSLWIRLVRVDEALSARAYTRGGTFVLRVIDEFCPWNDGRWHVDVDTDGARVERTERAPHLTLDVADLGALYLGGERLTRLHRAGRAVEHSAGAMRAIDTLFAADPAPWCPFVF